MSQVEMQPAKEPRLGRLADLIASRGFRRVLCGILIAWFGLIPAGMLWDTWESRQEQDRLLNHTDHQALLKACRDLMANHREVTMGDVENDPAIPDIIRGLGVSYITIKRDRVHIELHGGFDHYGVIACPEGDNREGGWLKLGDGLWYYGYKPGN